MDKHATSQELKFGAFNLLKATIPTAVVATAFCLALWSIYIFLPGGELRNPARTIGGTLFICFFAWLAMPAVCSRTRSDVTFTGIFKRSLKRPRLNSLLVLFAIGFGWLGHAVFYGDQSSTVHATLLSLQLTWSYWLPVILGTLVMHK